MWNGMGCIVLAGEATYYQMSLWMEEITCCYLSIGVGWNEKDSL